jgi:hypothetical protein
MVSSQVENLHLGQPQSATGQYAKSCKREKAIQGPELEWRTICSNYKQVMSHNPGNL